MLIEADNGGGEFIAGGGRSHRVENKLFDVSDSLSATASRRGRLALLPQCQRMRLPESAGQRIISARSGPPLPPS
jgi:hypothetical protein